MLPLIGTLLMSVIGHLAGKSIWEKLEASKAAAATPAANPTGTPPFKAELTDATQRYAQAPTVVSDVVSGPPLPPSTVGFGGDGPV
ncbi:MAG: hypothetical protein HY728_02970, partial [Candidatus Rokubacteria bacterium]|nr:hypothetical protein [Candidatus Rokubacteria bacterium]